MLDYGHVPQLYYGHYHNNVNPANIMLMKKILSVVAVCCILAGSLAAWVLIDLGYDGCCGVPRNYANDNVQLLTHLAALLVAIILAWFILRWGWKRK